MVKTIRFLSHYKRTAETSYEISAAKLLPLCQGGADTKVTQNAI
jgi:hypothetical protein